MDPAVTSWRKQDLALYQEYPQPGEEELARRLGEYLKYVVARKNFLSGTMRRDQHPKTVALLKARLEIDPNLPAQFRYGIFAQKPSYPCWIRLSNAAPMPPLASIAWNNSHAALARSSVSVSMNQAPCPGSITRPSALSSCSTRWVLRAMRRANASGLPIAQV